VPEALENAREIARRCNLDLKLGESVLPAFPVPKGQTEAEFLEAEARRGLEAQLMRLVFRITSDSEPSSMSSVAWDSRVTS
jgi:DNA polymerase-3 subunit alpha